MASKKNPGTFPIMHFICPLKIYISIVFNFSWDGCPGEMKNKGCAKFRGRGGGNKVHSGKTAIMLIAIEKAGPGVVVVDG